MCRSVEHSRNRHVGPNIYLQTGPDSESGTLVCLEEQKQREPKSLFSSALVTDKIGSNPRNSNEVMWAFFLSKKYYKIVKIKLNSEGGTFVGLEKQ